MKSTVPVGTGRSIAAPPRGARLRLEPRVPEGGQRGRRLHEARPRGDRRGRRLRGVRATACEALYEPLGGAMVRTDVASAEMIKLASNAFLATKISFINEIANVSEELGADVLEVARGHGPRRPDRPEVPAAGHRLRRLVLPEGRSGAQAARRQLAATTSSCSPRSSRSTSSRSGARSASSRSTSARWSARRSRCSAWPSSRTPTTSARPRASCSPAGSRARARTCASTTRSRPTRRGHAGRRRDRGLRARGARRRRRRGARDRVARVRASSTGRARSRGACACPLVVDGRNFLDREALVAAGFTYEGIGR